VHERSGLASSIKYQRRSRGIFGWLFLLAFWLFNGLMALFAANTWWKVGGGPSLLPLGQHIGAVIIPIYFRAVGAAILGLCAYATRAGHRVIIVADDPPRASHR